MAEPRPFDSELILFSGPPCCGKTRFFETQMSATHVRVGAREEFELGLLTSLHALVKKVVAMMIEVSRNGPGCTSKAHVCVDRVIL